MSTPYRVLFVCLGNICRSPLAEALLRSKDPEGRFEVDSAGTSGFHQGESPDYRTRKSAARHGLSMEGIRSRPIEPADLDRFDVILAMDRSNREALWQMAQTDAQRAKIRLMLDELQLGAELEVPDPFHGGDEGFEQVYALLDKACDALVERTRSHI
ncbi:low molecular weight phosphotyrosine protein phosphatase [bacterium]|nr:low molecular weight phosphotyrosine protein phosphatase [bacterium]